MTTLSFRPLASLWILSRDLKFKVPKFSNLGQGLFWWFHHLYLRRKLMSEWTLLVSRQSWRHSTRHFPLLHFRQLYCDNSKYAVKEDNGSGTEQKTINVFCLFCYPVTITDVLSNDALSHCYFYYYYSTDEAGIMVCQSGWINGREALPTAVLIFA